MPKILLSSNNIGPEGAKGTRGFMPKLSNISLVESLCLGGFLSG